MLRTFNCDRRGTAYFGCLRSVFGLESKRMRSGCDVKKRNSQLFPRTNKTGRDLSFTVAQDLYLRLIPSKKGEMKEIVVEGSPDVGPEEVNS